VPRSRIYGTIPPLPNMPSWRGARLKHRDNFTVYHYYKNGTLDFVILSLSLSEVILLFIPAHFRYT